MGEYNPKSKGLPTSWKGMQRRLPKALSTFQIVILAGFLSLLILRSTVGIASLSFTRQYTAADDEYAEEEQIRNSEVDSEPKRNLVQATVLDAIDKLQRTVMKNSEVEFEDELDAEIADEQAAEARAATGKAVKILGDSKVAEEDEKPQRPLEAVQKKPLPKPTVDIVEDSETVEAQLAEEETVEEFAAFEKFEKGKKEDKIPGSTKTKEAELKKVPKDDLLQLPSDPNLKTGSLTDDKPSEKSLPQTKGDKIDQKANAKKEKSGGKEQFQDHKFIDAEAMVFESSPKKKVDKPNAEEKVDESTAEEKAEDAEEEQKQPEMTPEQLEAFKQEAMTNMSRVTRRDDPNAYNIGPKISDWDEQRAAWLEKNPDMKSTDPHRPKVLLLSGSQPWPCNSPVGDHYLLKMIKNKVDYARIHKLETFYSFAHLDKPMSHFWAKLPLIRKMMLMRPEMEWIFWMDSDAMFTDMVFEIPFERYKDHNLVMWGYPSGVYEERSWVACNTGVMFLRNTQWTLDLLDIWSHMGPEGEIRNESGKILSSYLARRPTMMADDQSALVYLLITQPELREKVALEDEYYLSGYWVPLVGRYEEFSEKSKPGAGGRNWPFTTHFTGCQPCSGASNQLYEGNSCLEGMERAFNFADNQVLKPFGFEHESLQGAKVLRIRNETTKPIWAVPVDNPWAVQSFYS